MYPKPRPTWGRPKKPTPADWGLGMTVCVAAMCDSGKSIVAASDHKLTIGNLAAEGVALKGTPIGWEWNVMFAGDDMTHAKPILARTKELLSTYTKESDDYATYQMVASALADAHDERLHRQIEARYLRNFGLTVDLFREHGKEQLSSTLY